jgi:triacylglycerol lipase
MDIVLVHGIWDSGKVFRRMSDHLNTEGHRCFAPDLRPANGAHGLADLAHKLQVYIEAIPAQDPLALVGFSMGSLVSRYYLQRLDGLEHVSHFFSISGPHRGTITAHLWPGRAAREMRFGSDFLKDLNADLDALKQIHIQTYRTPFDLMIMPGGSSKLPGTDDRLAYAALHHQMLHQRTVFEHIAKTLRRPAD